MSIGVYMVRDAAVRAAPDLRAQAGTRLLQLALAHHLDTEPALWQIGRAANGARIVTQGPGPVPLLSVTHSGDLLAVAVAAIGQGSAGIGIDIEQPRPRSYAKIARHLGWPDSFWGVPQAPTQDEFLHVWTLWEALYKSMADGSRGDRRAALAAAGHIRAGTSGGIAAANWSGCSRRGPEGCWLSVVSQPAGPFAFAMFRVDRLAGDVDSARIETITAPEGEFHF